MRRSLLAVCVTAAAFAPTSPPGLVAQAATTTWNMRFTIPDSLQTQTMGISEVDARFILATDGQNLAFQAEPGPTSSVNGGGGLRLHVIVPASGDSVHLGVVVPPELAAQLGGGVGWRLSIAIPDSLPVPLLNPDSIINEEMPRTEQTGTTDVVAGITCDNWLVHSKPDSIGHVAPPATICIAESVPAFNNITAVIKRLVPDLVEGIDKWSGTNVRMFGGRDVSTLSLIFGDESPLVVRLESLSETAPDPSFFAMPPGLEPLPPEMLMMFSKAASQESGQ